MISDLLQVMALYPLHSSIIAGGFLGCFAISIYFAIVED